MSLRSSSLNRSQALRRAPESLSSYASNLPDGLVLPPLFQSSKASRSSVGLRQMKLPGGADTWTVPEVHHGGSRPPRFREWVAQSGLGLEREAAMWDVSRETKTSRPPKFQSAFAATGRSTSRSGSRSRRRSRSALSTIRSVYTGSAAEDDGCDGASVLAESAAETAVTTASGLHQELAQLRTGDEAVRFFARHGGNCAVKVLYCNRQPPDEDSREVTSSLVVVPEHKVKPEHFTISANGVFHVCPGEMSECTPLSEWLRHGMIYSVMKSMPFFKLFAYQKNFEHWRANARYEGFCRQRQRLSRSCFLAKPLFVEALANLHRLISEVEKVPLLHLTQDSHRLCDFTDTQHAVRSNPSSGARVQLERMHETISEMLGGLVASVQKAFAEVPSSQDQGRRRSGAKSKSMAQEKQEARDEAKKQLFAERDLASLGNFIRLADFMFQGARVTSVMEAALSFSRRLGSGHRMFSVDAGFAQEGAVLNPSRDEFSNALKRLWDGVLQTMSSLPPLASSYQFKNFVSPELRQGGQTVEEILHRCGTYSQEIAQIESVIVEQLATAKVSANEQYMRYHGIYKFGEEWNERSFVKEAHTLESLAGKIKHMSDLKAELVSFRTHRTSGVFMVHGSALRSMLEPIPERGLAVMMRLLAALAHEKCITASQQVTVAIKALDERPTTPQSIETYRTLCGAVETQLTASEAVADDLEAAWRLLMKQGYRIAVEDQLQLDMLQKKRRDLDEVKLPQAKAYLANLPPPAEPDIVVTLHASPRGDHDWSLTCMGIGGDELATLRMDLQEEVLDGFKDALAGRLGVPSQRLQLVQADGSVLTDEGYSAGDGEEASVQSMATLLGQRGSGGAGSPTRKHSSRAAAQESSLT